MVVFDTSLIIDYLRNQGDRKTLFEEAVEKLEDENLAISVLTVQELFQGKSLGDEEEEKRVLEVIAPFEVLEYTIDIAKRAGKIARENSGASFVDAAIAATAITYGVQLATLNRKDFEKIKGLELCLV
jgi:predicted nucleic acid-binding protein